MDVLTTVPPTADHRIHYGAGESQLGDLRLPAGTAKQLAGAGHFDVVDPESKAWPVVQATVLEMMQV